MKNSKFFCGALAAAFALSLVGADIASAQGGRGQGGGRGACVQNQSQTCPNYQVQGQGQGRKKGQGRQQRLRDGSCVNNPGASQPANTLTIPAPSNN